LGFCWASEHENRLSCESLILTTGDSAQFLVEALLAVVRAKLAGGLLELLYLRLSFCYETTMPKIMCLYMDDSGTRNPDRKIVEDLTYRDWFTLGGFLMKEVDGGVIRTLHAEFCEKWGIKYPLHSYDIRLMDKRFSWLRTASVTDRGQFMRDLSAMLTKIPVIGYAAVVDRPGYNKRYRAKYGRQTWNLCQTAFSVICERAAKRARAYDCKLRVYVEEGDKTADD
jgi:hypothetical protein